MFKEESCKPLIFFRVDESKDILEETLKENDCDLLTSDNDNVVETEENRRTCSNKWWLVRTKICKND